MVHQKKKFGHRSTTNSSNTTLIPSRDGRSVVIQTTAFPMEHTECGHYWLTTSNMHAHNMSWMWQHYHKTSISHTISRGSKSAQLGTVRYCNNPIVFDDNIVSKNGVRKPLNEWDHKVHDCKFSPYNLNKVKASAEENKIDEWVIIDDLKEKVQQ